MASLRDKLYAERQLNKHAFGNRTSVSGNENRSTSNGSTSNTTEMGSINKQKHFALLNRVLDSQFRKIILVGLLNIIIIGVFVAALFFLHFLNHKDPHSNDKEGSTTVSPTELTPSMVPASLKYTCADGFDLVSNKCWQVNIDLPPHQGAEQVCNTRGSTLFTIKSEHEDQAFQAWMNHRHHRSWMGLTCNGSDNTTCVWDDGEKAPFSYVAFEDDDCCLYYNVSGVLGKQWTCDNCGLMLSYVCELPQTIEANCTNNFNMHCYNYYSQPMLLTDALDYCRHQNGNLVSIHSRPENIFLQAIEEIQSDYIWLGGILNSKNYVVWIDGTPMNYNGLSATEDYNNKEPCLLMKIGGNWTTTECSKTFPFICKVPIPTVTQAPTTTTTITTVATATIVNSSPETTTTPRPAPLPTTNPNSICTEGYTLVSNKCIKLITQPASQTSAYEICSKTGASLVVIKSGEENRGIGEYLKSQDLRKIWIGLQCTGNDKSSCQWDFGQGDLTSYSNFVTGSPNVGYGNCVFYLYNESLPDAGQWGNGNCDVDQLSYLCEMPPTINDYCDFNYNKHCYTRIDYGFTFTDAQDACQRICSNLISIHSELENRFVTSMFNITGYLLLGGVAPAKDLVMWLDGSPRDYNNLKPKKFTTDQNCIYMNYISGDWQSVDCASAAWPVCKRKAGARC